ncbi:MAG: hypothetical protein V1755_10305 [Chloroflexota bacterium]
MKTMHVAIAAFLLIGLAGCAGEPIAATQVTAATPEIPAPAPEPSPTPSGPAVVGTLLDSTLSLNVTHATGVKIERLAVGLNNEIFAIDFQGDTIYQLMEDGSLAEHVKLPRVKMDYFNIAPDGSFWFINNLDWGLYRVDDQGQPQALAHEMNRLFAFDSTGNLFAVDLPSDNVQKISHDGKVEVIASGFQSQRIAVGPDDSVYVVTYNGDLARVEADGSLKVIATGFGIENAPAFAPDGSMYVLSGEGLKQVDLATGQITQIEWYDRYRNIGGTLIFDRQGIGYIFHPIQPLYRLDLQAQALEMVYSPFGNSWALGVEPLGENVYVAYGDRLPSGRTTLFHVAANGDLQEIGSVAYGMEVSLAFSGDGIGYLSVADTDRGAMIYSFNTQDKTLQEFYEPECFAQGMAVEPATGALWWTECNQLASYTTGQAKQTIPYLEGVNSSTIAFGADGTLYALIWFRPAAPHMPMEHGIYRYEGGNWVQVNDMTAKDPGITLAELGVCPDDHVYVAASIDGEGVSLGREGSSMSTLLRLEKDNTLSLIGYDLGHFDPLAIACAPSGTVYFTNAQGIYSIPNLGARP